MENKYFFSFLFLISILNIIGSNQIDDNSNIVPVLRSVIKDRKVANKNSFKSVAKNQTHKGSKIVLDYDYTVKFNSSLIIVWEKCGINARTKITKLFQSIDANDEITLLYDPSMNVLMLQTVYNDNTKKMNKNYVKFPQNIECEMMFLLFNEPGKINIYLECPSASKTKYELESNDLSSISEISLAEANTKAFNSLSSAMEVFKCKSVLTVWPGIILNFNGEFLNGTETNVMLTFFYSRQFYSINYQPEQTLSVTSLNEEIVSIKLNKQIGMAGIFLEFQKDGIRFFVNCPFNQEANALWSTNIFSTKINLETYHSYQFGVASNPTLLSSFCSSNNILKMAVGESVSNEIIQSSIHSVETANKILTSFLPKLSIMEHMNSFIINNRLQSSQLIENEPRILIASRDHAESEFFFKGINDYVKGFTDGQRNFWIGLDMLNKMTSANKYRIKIIATSINQLDYIEEYAYFKVGNKSEKYKLYVKDLIFGKNGHFAKNDGSIFSTYDFGNKILALSQSSGYWHNEINEYCFTCVSNNYENGSAANISLSQANNIEVFVSKMYIIPVEKVEVKVNLLPESDILPDSRELFDVLGFSADKDHFKLLYKGSIDGFTAKSFHLKCDGYNKTLTLIKSDNSSIFGGYTEASWDSFNIFKEDPNAFIFSYSNKYNEPGIFRRKEGSGYAIYTGYNHLPTFGGLNIRKVISQDQLSNLIDSPKENTTIQSIIQDFKNTSYIQDMTINAAKSNDGQPISLDNTARATDNLYTNQTIDDMSQFDFTITSNCNNEYSYSNLGQSFEFKKLNRSAKDYLAGSERFKVVEIEVYWRV